MALQLKILMSFIPPRHITLNRLSNQSFIRSILYSNLNRKQNFHDVNFNAIRTFSSCTLQKRNKGCFSNLQFVNCLTSLDGQLAANISTYPCSFQEKKSGGIELMDEPLVLTPSILTMCQNYLVYLFLVPTYDREFNIGEFCKNSIKALEVVTSKLSTGMIDELKELFTEDCLSQISTKFPLLSLKERHHLLILEERLQLFFPFLIKVVHKDGKVFLEVSMCYYIYYGDKKNTNLDSMKFVFANCRFTREYTAGVEDNWTISLLNYAYSDDVLDPPPS